MTNTPACHFVYICSWMLILTEQNTISRQGSRQRNYIPSSIKISQFKLQLVTGNWWIADGDRVERDWTTCMNPNFTLWSRGTNAHLSGTIILLKKLSYEGASLQNYSVQSYAPCLATESCQDEQLYQVWCWYLYYFLKNGLH